MAAAIGDHRAPCEVPGIGRGHGTLLAFHLGRTKDDRGPASRAGQLRPLHAPPPLLLPIVEAGLLGRKRGRGFHDYSEKGN